MKRAASVEDLKAPVHVGKAVEGPRARPRDRRAEIAAKLATRFAELYGPIDRSVLDPLVDRIVAGERISDADLRAFAEDIVPKRAEEPEPEPRPAPPPPPPSMRAPTSTLRDRERAERQAAQAALTKAEAALADLAAAERFVGPDPGTEHVGDLTRIAADLAKSSDLSLEAATDYVAGQALAGRAERQGRAIARAVRAARVAQGLTQQQLADRTGLGLRTIRNAETGTATPGGGNLVRIAGALALNLSDLQDHGL